MARDYNRNNRQNENENYNDVTNRIKSLNQLSDLSIKDIADEGGYADKVAKGSKKLKTNQLRKFFGAVRLIEQKTTWDEIEPEFYLLKPKLAVAVGRKTVPISDERKDYLQTVFKNGELIRKENFRDIKNRTLTYTRKR